MDSSEPGKASSYGVLSLPLKLSSFFPPRSITYHLHGNTLSNGAVCVTSVIPGIRTQLTEEGPALTTEFYFSLLVDHALVLLRTQILHEPVFSHSGYQIPHTNVIYVHPMGWLPTYRAGVRDADVFCGQHETGLAESMATP